MSDVVSPSGAPPAAVARVGWRELRVGGMAFVLLVAVGADQGGYFPGAWGWAALACAWAAALVLILDDGVRISRRGTIGLGSLAGLTGWTLLSVLWSPDATSSVLDAQRTLVYLSALLAGLVVCRRAPAAFLVGTWAAIWLLSSYGLATRLFPDRLGVYDSTSAYRLSAPIGYWNSLGLFAAMGALLAVGLATRGERRLLRTLAGASIPLLLVTQYFTFSRGAMIGVACGAVALVVVEPRRLHLLARVAAVAPWTIGGLLLAAASQGLTTVGVPLAEATHDGHRLAALLAVLAAGAAASVRALGWLDARVEVGPGWRQGIGATLLVALAIGLGATFVRFGAPWTIARHTWRTFSTDMPNPSTNLTEHLFNLHTSRVVAWRVAVRVADAHPLLGAGAGTYERYWLLDRGDQMKLRDAHSLYLQTLAELGPVGLLLLAGTFLTALWAGVRARRRRFAAPVAAALVAYLAHASGDWHWQIPGVTLAAVLCAAFLLVDEPELERPAPRLARRGLFGLAALAAAAGLYGIAERTALARIDRAWADVPKAERAARTAADLAPWSTEPWSRLAEVALDAHRYGVARDAVGRALRKDPGDWQLWLDLARASNGVQRIEALRRAERLNPHGPEIAAFRQTLASLSELPAGG